MTNVLSASVQKIRSLIKSHGHHFIFGISIISLTALLVWWSVFIHNSIQQRRIAHYEKLDLDLKYLSLKLGMDENQPPVLGVLIQDERFEVISCYTSEKRFLKRLDPPWSEFCIRPRFIILQQIEEEFKRLNVMLIGEASFLILIILVSSVFLYRFIQLERRTSLEVKEFWERSAHEIKTPITGIKAFLQNLKNRSYDTEELIPYIDMALKQVGKQEQLAENILSGYLLTSKGVKLKMVDINLNEFLTAYFNKSALHLADATVHFDFKEDKEIRARADTNSLKVILDNITDNAIKYCTPGLVLKVDIAQMRKKAVVIIKDNGPGMPPNLVDNVFQAYKHLDDELPTERHGAGLGLFISRQLARNMGGDLSASSEGKGQGTEFKIIINLVK